MKWFPWSRTDPKDVTGLAVARERERAAEELAKRLNRHLVENGFGRAFDIALHAPRRSRGRRLP